MTPGFFYYDDLEDAVRFHTIGKTQAEDICINTPNGQDRWQFLLQSSSKNFVLICQNHKFVARKYNCVTRHH